MPIDFLSLLILFVALIFCAFAAAMVETALQEWWHDHTCHQGGKRHDKT